MINFINKIDLPTRLLNKSNEKAMEGLRDKALPISDQERQEIIKRMKDKYGVHANVGKIDNPEKSVYFHGGAVHPQQALFMKGIDEKDFIRENPHFYENHKNHNIFASNHKDILLHEHGHANDEHYGKFVGGIALANLAAPFAATIGGAQATKNTLKNNEENSEAQKSTLNAALKGAAVGTGLGAASMAGSGLLQEYREDRANNFVKKYMTDELGSAGKAKEWFNNSSLPHGRKTYRNATLISPLHALPMGLTGAAIGAGSYHLNKKIKDMLPQEKTASFTMVSLYK